ncbi:hypothetical protein QBC35DRAFT_464721 [Podospora australis]|uniref:Uncharacterized protein n=1 Tax=Podospora australis TaxID=1536484 RepID=A0AAN7AGJ1_9PEZI|nr:hypothetical protein QBC35DRAFT_464721 [Podospora australis]
MTDNHPDQQGRLQQAWAVLQGSWPFRTLAPSILQLIPEQLQSSSSDNREYTGSTTTARGMYDEDGIYLPSPVDVLVVREMLTRATLAGDTTLPPELINKVLDFAEYWPHSATEVAWGDDDPKRIYGSHREHENQFLLRTLPLGIERWGSPDLFRRPIGPKPPSKDETNEYPVDCFQKLAGASSQDAHLLKNPCRRIVFTIRSHDQGWGGEIADHGTHRGSWTWFEAGHERWYKGDPEELMSELAMSGSKESDEEEVEESGGTTKEGRDDERNQRQIHQPQKGEQSSSSSNQPQEMPSMKLQDLSTLYPRVRFNNDGKMYEFLHPTVPEEDHKIQCNITADREWQDHRVVWSYDDDVNPEGLEEAGRGTATGDGKFVRELKLGDVVTVWGKARFPGWVNNISSVKVDVFWAL